MKYHYSVIIKEEIMSFTATWMDLEIIILKWNKSEKQVPYDVRKHLTGGFLCAVLDLSGSLCSLLIPEYSGIKRRGKTLPGAEESRHFLH